MTEQLSSADKEKLIEKVKQEIAIANVSELLKVGYLVRLNSWIDGFNLNLFDCFLF